MAPRRNEVSRSKRAVKRPNTRANKVSADIKRVVKTSDKALAVQQLPHPLDLVNVRRIDDRMGQGTFATSHIAKGTLMFAEVPEIIIANATFEANPNDAVAQLTEPQLQHLRQLAGPPTQAAPVRARGRRKNDQHSDMSAEALRFKNNAFEVNTHWKREEIRDSSAVFKKISRMNHSCLPNAHNVWWTVDCPANERMFAPGYMMVRAAQNIKKGTEITIDYLHNKGWPDTKERKAELRYRWGFDCRCSLCYVPGPQQINTSAPRRRLMDLFYNDLNNIIDNSDDEAALRRIHEYVEWIELEMGGRSVGGADELCSILNAQLAEAYVYPDNPSSSLFVNNNLQICFVCKAMGAMWQHARSRFVLCKGSGRVSLSQWTARLDSSKGY